MPVCSVLYNHEHDHRPIEPKMQRTGRQEMTLQLRDQGPAAAADYATRFERYANEWLLCQGFAPGFVFKPIALPPIA